MELAKKGLLERQSLEASCLVADGEDLDLSGKSYPYTIFSFTNILPRRASYYYSHPSFSGSAVSPR